MKPRKQSIRFTLFMLLTVPFVSLVTLWTFAAQGTVREALQGLGLDTINRVYGDAATPMLIHVARERLESVTWLSGGGRAPRTQLEAQRRQTDAALANVRKAAKNSDFRDALNDTMEQRLEILLGKIDNLDSVRRAIDTGTINKLDAFNAYNDILDAHFRFSYLMIEVEDATIFRQAGRLVDISRAQELTAREAALISGALVAGGRLPAGEHAAFTKLAIEQRYLVSEAVGGLLPDIGAPFKRLLGSTTYSDFKTIEDRIMAGRPGRVQVRIAPATWRSISQAFVDGLDDSMDEARVVLGARAKTYGTSLILRLGLVGGVGLIAVAASAFLMLRFGRRISRELIELQDAAVDLADRRLPRVVARLRRGEDVDVGEEASPIVIGDTAEVVYVAQAFSTVQRTAIEAAVGQAELRKAVNHVFRNLARRNQALLHRQLAMLDALEHKATDPDELEDLFRLDHLTTRMRRHAESLIILSGAPAGRGWRNPVSILDVLRGAVGEIEDYTRVDVITRSREAIVGSAVADLIHLIAELVENAVNFSPPSTPVEVDAGVVGNGFVIEIEDRGLGMSAEKLAEVNTRLADPPDFNLSESDQLGLFVVGSLAERHGIRVSLRANEYGGLTAIVLLPHALVVTGKRRGGIADAAGLGDTADAGADPSPYTDPSPYAGTSLDGASMPGAERQRLNVVWASAEAEAETAAAAAAAATDPPAVGKTVQETVFPEQRQAAATGTWREPPAGTDAGMDGGMHAGMPRRVRRASLAPGLRRTPPGATSTGGPGAGGTSCGTGTDTGPGSTTAGLRAVDAETREPSGVPARSPERARSVMASMQGGWRRGRAERLDACDTGTGNGPDTGPGDDTTNATDATDAIDANQGE